MNKKKKFIVLDVEGYSDCRPYDVGFQVVDKSGNIYEEYSVSIMPAVEENLLKFYERRDTISLKSANEMAHRNIHEILTDTQGKYLKCYDIERFFKALLSVIVKYKVTEIWAYNVTFDRSALRRLFGEENFSILSEMVNFCDIIPAILYTKLLTKKYVKFCHENGYLTDKGNLQTKAEVVYRFLTGNNSFEEEHTGLADVKIETEILLAALKAKKKLHKKPVQSWKILHDFCTLKKLNTLPPEPVKMLTENS